MDDVATAVEATGGGGGGGGGGAGTPGMVGSPVALGPAGVGSALVNVAFGGEGGGGMGGAAVAFVDPGEEKFPLGGTGGGGGIGAKPLASVVGSPPPVPLDSNHNPALNAVETEAVDGAAL